MTTIAYRDGMMAGDTSSIYGSAIMLTNMTKVIRWETPQRIYLGGCAGTTAMCGRFRQWIIDGAEGYPPAGKDPENSIQALLAVFIKETGKVEVWLYEASYGGYQVQDEYVAVGSGTDFAVAAMWMGGDARQAVQAALRFDTLTNGHAEVVRFGRGWYKGAEKAGNVGNVSPKGKNAKIDRIFAGPPIAAPGAKPHISAKRRKS